MDKQAGRVSIGTIILFCIVVVLLVGITPIMDFLHGWGLLGRASAQEVQDELKRRSPRDSIECQVGTGGWDYICDVVHRPPGRGDNPSRSKYGVMSSPYSAAGGITALPVDQPTPARDEFTKRNQARREAEQKRLTETLDLNLARVDQLKALPGVDEALAYRIAQAVIHKRFTTVDDLLTVEGVDRAMLERIRPLVRVDK